MRVVVCTKETPDTAARVEVTDDGSVSWGDAPLVINPWDEYAVEEAILLRDERGAEATTVIGMGTEATNEALKHALAMGCDDAILISDEAFANADGLVTSAALAAAINKLDDVGLAVFGKETADGNAGIIPAMVGRQLGWNTITYVFKIVEIDFAAGTIKVERLIEDGKQIVESTLPAAISVVKDINEPRYPSFMGIRKASRAEIPVWDAGELGIEAEAKVTWPEIFALPPKEGECVIISEGTVEESAAVLADKLIEEKVV